jgi:tetratricopeptide (TPR) repeat protein
MGVVYTEQGNYTRALECFEPRLQIDLLLDDKLSLAKTIGNIGIVYQERGEYAQALTCYQKLLSVTTELGDRQNTAVAVGNMIKLYTAQNQYDIAEQLARRAIRLGRALDIPLYLCEYLYDAADLFARQDRYEEARMLNDEALQTAQRIELRNVHFRAALLDIRLQRDLDLIGSSDAASRLEALLSDLTEDHERAAVLYELWRSDAAREAERRNAAELYRRLHAASPNFEYRQRYHNLTGEHLPDPAPLPALPPSVRQNSITLEALLARVDQMMAELK